VYTRFAGTDNYLLPFIENITGDGTDGAMQELSFLTRRLGGGLDIRMINTNFVGDPGTFGGSGNVYRYIIIPAPSSDSGRVSFSSSDDTKRYYEEKGVDFSDYNSIASYFNLSN